MSRASIILATLLVFHLGSNLVSGNSGVQEIEKFSAFKKINTERLLKGGMQAKRSTINDMTSVMSVQTSYVINKPLEKTFKGIINWDISKHSETGVLEHEMLDLEKPLFKKLSKEEFVESKSHIKQLISNTQSIASGSIDHALNLEEANKFKGKDYSSAESVTETWKDVFSTRLEAFDTKGLSGILPYEKPSRYNHQKSITELFKHIPKIKENFAEVITALEKGPSNHDKIKRQYYFEIMKVLGDSIMDLGVILSHEKDPKSKQLLDFQFYVSRQYFSSLIFYHLIPLEENKTLVWRGDYVISETWSWTRGIERVATEKILLQEINTAVSHQISDIEKLGS